MSEPRLSLDLVENGIVPCPKKGEMAIQRCREWQRETGDAGAPCTCSVFNAFQAASESRCGTRADDKALFIDDDSPESDEETWNDTATNQKEPAMARTAERCSKCNNFSPGDTRLYKGICQPCRRKIAAEAEKREKEERAEKIRRRVEAQKKPAPQPIDEAREASDEIKEIVAKHIPAPAPAPEPKTRQFNLPAVAQMEIERLQKELDERDRKIVRLEGRIGKFQWVVDGLKKGYAQLEHLFAAVSGGD